MNRKIGIQNKYREYIVNYSMSDNLIFENGQVVKYESSKQYIEDTNRYHLTKELEEEKRKNGELTKIVNTKLRKDMKLDVKGKEPNEYQKKLYLLRNMQDANAKKSVE